jgi:uncharacterized damage-inducible protein DinB
MITARYCRTMARYNRWMNERLFALCAGLDDAERRRDRGAFFRSIHGTLNHLLVGDRIWMGRFLGRPFAASGLDEELYADFVELGRERAATDAEILAWANALDDAALAGTVTYRSLVDAADRTYPLGFAVTHLFNHQTHHRGQLTTLLSQAGHDPGATDLLWLPPEEG